MLLPLFEIDHIAAFYKTKILMKYPAIELTRILAQFPENFVICNTISLHKKTACFL